MHINILLYTVCGCVIEWMFLSDRFQNWHPQLFGCSSCAVQLARKMQEKEHRAKESTPNTSNNKYKMSIERIAKLKASNELGFWLSYSYWNGFWVHFGCVRRLDPQAHNRQKTQKPNFKCFRIHDQYAVAMWI